MVMVSFQRIAVFLLLMSCSLLSLALEPFPHAREMFHSEVQTNDYILALGPMKKINGRWVSDKEQRLQGQLVRTTYAVNETHTADEVFSHFARQFRELGMRELYLCEGRGCGSSNSWANDHFGVKQLYGPDDQQQYLAAEWVHDNGETDYFSLYAVTRGNKRGYVHLEKLTTTQMHQIDSSPEVVTQNLEQYRRFELSNVRWQGDTPQLPDDFVKQIAQIINRHPAWKMAVVGHDWQGHSVEESMQRSQQHAKALQQQLLSMGVPAGRLSSYGVGPLAPTGKENGDIKRRLVLVRVAP